MTDASLLSTSNLIFSRIFEFKKCYRCAVIIYSEIRLKKIVFPKSFRVARRFVLSPNWARAGLVNVQNVNL